MRTKLTLDRPQHGPVDVVVTADATATVGDVVRTLLAADPAGATAADAATTLEVVAPSTSVARVLDPAADLTRAGLRSGSWVRPVRRSDAFRGAGDDRGPVVAVARVLAGPDAGREFGLPAGTSYVGRDYDMDVRLADPMVSKRHARLTVGDAVEVADLNSSNGVVLGERRVARAALGVGDAVTLGDTVLVVVPLQRTAGGAPPTTPVVEVTRSPRVVPRFPARELPHPKPPQVPAAQRLPYLAALAPMVMGTVLWLATRQWTSVLFMAMSPMLLLGGWFDNRSTARRTLRAQERVFAESVTAAAARIDADHDVERAVRLAEHPSLAECVDAVDRLGPLLWTRRPEHREFGCVRLGLGTGPSALSMRLPEQTETAPRHWEALVGLAERAGQVSDVPVVGDLRLAGSIAVAGPVIDARSTALGLVFQLVALHAPGELLVAAFTSRSSRAAWDWLQWLPHAGGPEDVLGGHHFAADAAAATLLLERLEGVVEARRGDGDGRRGPLDPGAADAAAPAVPTIVVLVEDDAAAPRSRLIRLAETGPDAGIHLLWVAPTVEQVPAACRTFLVVRGEGSTSGEVRHGLLRFPVATERLDPESVLARARTLAGVIDAGAVGEDESDLPRSVAYPALAGTELLDDPDAVAERWQQSGSVVARDGSAPGRRRPAALTAIVGMGASAPLAIDLRLHGPHALVGGTTGAGKSEFLQAWVLGMAQHNSPDRLTFLFVDYKGGAAFADCIRLPHCVGLVTDLSPHLVRRALASLRAELRRREHLLNQKKAKDLVSLERSGDPDCPPSLVIVVDEFAALATEVPEFVDGVVDVAQRGRSLGLHLILATQRPAGVIKENLRANTNLRIALRMADADDSVDILGDPMAAHFDPTIPGRGAMRTGPGRIQSFQTGYAGGWTTDAPVVQQVEVVAMDFGSGASWELPPAARHEEPDPGPTDIARMVGTLRQAADRLTITPPRHPWLDELAPRYDFALLPNPRTDEKLLLGVADSPSTQSQPTTFYEPDVDGNLAVYGTGGAGKSATLRSLAVAAAVTPRGGPVQVYGLDFGSRGLRPLEDLPHVAAVVDGDDQEGVARVLRRIRDLADQRASRFAAVRADSIAEYRARAQVPDEPRVLLLVDGLSAFRETYENAMSPEFSMFAQIAADGRGVGVHVVLTADRPSAVPTSIAATVQRRLVLRMASDDDYTMLGVPRDVLGPTSPPGRGLLDGQEVQVAILGGSPNLAVQARELTRLAESMRRHGVRQAPPVRRLPARVALNELAVDGAGGLVVGLDDETLEPAVIAPSGTLLVSGPPGAGRSTTLATIAASVRRQQPNRRTVLLSPRRSAIAELGMFTEAHTSLEAVESAAERIADDIAARRLPAGAVAVFVESLADLADTTAEPGVRRLVTEAVRAEALVVAETESSTWGQAYGLSGPFKAGRRGVLLIPSDVEGDVLLNTPLGRFRAADMPPGRGFVIAGGRGRRAQVALPE